MKLKLTGLQKLRLMIGGRVYVGMKKKPHWTKGKLPFYVFRCQKHGLVEDYPHGWEDDLSCPECVKK